MGKVKQGLKTTWTMLL